MSLEGLENPNDSVEKIRKRFEEDPAFGLVCLTHGESTARAFGLKKATDSGTLAIMIAHTLKLWEDSHAEFNKQLSTNK